MQRIIQLLLTPCLLTLFNTIQAQIIQPANDTLGRKFLIRSNLDEQKVLGKNELGTMYALNQDGMVCLAAEKAENAIIPNAFSGTGNVDPQPFPFYYDRPLVPETPLRLLKKPATKLSPARKIPGKPLTEAELVEMIKKNRDK